MQNDKSEPTEPKGAEGSNPPSDGAEDPVKVKGISAVAVLWTFGKCLSALLPVYLAGYYRVSTSLLVFGMMVYTGWKHVREAKEERLRSAMQLLSDGDDYASSRLSKIKRDLPAWVNFPDVEKVEWLNKVLQQVWPFVGQYLEKLLVETIAPSIRASTTHLQTFNFTKVDMGDKAMKVVGIKAHTENDKGQVLLDLYISYVGNVEINVEVKRYFCKAGVKGIQLHGMMRVILEPLIGDVPIVGAVTMFFIRRPKLDINWTGLTNLFDIPGVNAKSDSMIMDAIASFLVLPNRLVVPLVPDLHLAQLRCPLPRGVVRIHLLEAQNLPAKDHNVKGVMAGLSDPYAVLRVGPQTFTSKHIDNTDCPKWGEMYEVIVHEVPGQELEVEVYDKDRDQDDFLGRTKLDLGVVKNSIVVDDWFTLKESSSGRIHFRLEWLSLLPNTDKLEQVLKKSKAVTGKNLEPLSSAVLVVYLDKAKALPMTKGNKEPNPTVHISVQDTKRESKTCYTTIDPEWEQAFTFFIQDPHKQDIDFQVKDVDSKQLLGSLRIPLPRILEESSLSLDQWFQLENSGPASRIYVNAVLRVLWLDEENIKSDVSSGVAAAMQKPLPQKSSPHPSFATEGLLRIHLLAGQNLVPKDNWIGSMLKGKSDPYVKISIGGETFTSQTIKENLNPTWNEMYEVVLRPQSGQEVQVELFDKDLNKDDFLGRFKICVSDIIQSQFKDQWYTLNDVNSGRVRLITEWVPTVSRNDALAQVMQLQSLQSYRNKAVPSAALLFVFMDRARMLPFKKSGKEPKAGAELLLGNTTYKTKVCERSTSPQWSEAFHFLVHKPKEEMLIVKLSSAWDQPMGSLVVPVKELLSEPQLVLDKWLHLDGASPESEILLRAELKILDTRMTDVPKPSAAASKKEVDAEKIPKAAHVEEKSSELPATQSPKVSEPQKEPEAAHPDLSTEKPDPRKPADVQTTLDVCPSSATIKEQSQDLKTHHEPSAQTDCTTMEDLAQSTFSGLPTDKKPSAKVSEIPKAETALQSRTTPPRDFGKEGVLRIHLLEAKNLVAKDIVLGKGKSDPYVKINIGGFMFKSHVIKENLNPTWNEMYEVVLSGNHDQDIKFEAFDKDLNSDDFLGRFSVRLNEVMSAQYTDQWFTLKDVKSGQVHVILEWVPTVSSSIRLDQVMQLESLQSYQNKAVPSAALLFVYIQAAQSLPLKKSGKEPRAGAELVLGEASSKTKLCDRSANPQWNESFHFVVRDPKRQTLIVKLSSGWDEPMGSLVVPVRELLSEPELVLDRWFHLDGASAYSQILLRAELKILNTKMLHLIGTEALPCAAASAGQLKMSLTYAPQQKKLVVLVHACRGLLAQSKDGVDSYVSLMLLPDKTKATKRKTAVKKKDLNPEYNERFEFDLPEQEVPFKCLSASVKNNSFRGKDVIGQVQVELAQMDLKSGITQWFALSDEAE
ncbi:extended synaptotagmin-1 isoform X2 [Oryzias latipes]|uniref:extended synaptotagmin-1 isoform X2 n=1 Tax=Oryzias latipes TaxID=8090 RepID=UPI000CE1B1C2|nr:extended synaptotagmin-1 isoform X2 [Oryzias latipes]